MTVYDKNLKKLALKIGFAMLLFYGMFSLLGTIAVVIEEILGEFMYADAAHIIGQTLYGCIYFLSFTVPAILICKLQKKQEGYRSINFSAKLPKYTPLIIVAAIAINYAVAYFNNIIFMPLLPTFNEMVDATTASEISPWARIIMMVFTTAIVPALCEEFLFRGAILSNLAPYGRGAAILFSSLLFGLMHQNLFQIIYTTVLGVVIGYVYVKTKSIWCCVLIHFFNNGSSVLQEALMLTLDTKVADVVTIIMDVAIVSVGVVSLLFLIRKRAQKPDYEDVGSFGVIHEPDIDYEEYLTTKGKKLKMLLSPTTIVFAVLSIASMAITLVSILLAGALGL